MDLNLLTLLQMKFRPQLKFFATDFKLKSSVSVKPPVGVTQPVDVNLPALHNRTQKTATDSTVLSCQRTGMYKWSKERQITLTKAILHHSDAPTIKKLFFPGVNPWVVQIRMDTLKVKVYGPLSVSEELVMLNALSTKRWRIVAMQLNRGNQKVKSLYVNRIRPFLLFLESRDQKRVDALKENQSRNMNEMHQSNSKNTDEQMEHQSRNISKVLAKTKNMDELIGVYRSMLIQIRDEKGGDAIFNPQTIIGPWTEKHDATLMKLYLMLGPKWTLISGDMPGWGPDHITNRYNHLIHKKQQTTPWTDQEIELLLRVYPPIQNKRGRFNLLQTDHFPRRSCKSLSDAVKKYFYKYTKSKLSSAELAAISAGVAQYGRSFFYTHAPSSLPNRSAAFLLETWARFEPLGQKNALWTDVEDKELMDLYFSTPGRNENSNNLSFILLRQMSKHLKSALSCELNARVGFLKPSDLRKK